MQLTISKTDNYNATVYTRVVVLDTCTGTCNSGTGTGTKTAISDKPGVTVNFWKHLQRVHSNRYEKCSTCIMCCFCSSVRCNWRWLL